MEHKQLTFIGGGHMAYGLVSGLIAGGYPPEKISVADRHPEKCERLTSAFGIQTDTDNHALAEQAEVLCFAIKPQQLQSTITSLKTLIEARNPLIVSIAAGVRIGTMIKWLGKKAAIVRAMPNAPALLRAGITALYANPFVSPEQKETAETILRSVGSCVWLNNESHLDIVTALSGSGPAYYFMMMQALIDAAVKAGLSNEQAHLLTVETALGSARMVLECEVPVSRLIEQVASPGGTTEKVIEVLKHHDFKTIMQEALEAGKDRANEIANAMIQEP